MHEQKIVFKTTLHNISAILKILKVNFCAVDFFNKSNYFKIRLRKMTVSAKLFQIF